jgi:hypothetical protein
LLKTDFNREGMRIDGKRLLQGHHKVGLQSDADHRLEPSQTYLQDFPRNFAK